MWSSCEHQRDDVTTQAREGRIEGPPEMLTNFQARAFDHQSETETVSSNSFRHKNSGTETPLGESDGHPDNNS
jgi:hypothetical protein